MIECETKETEGVRRALPRSASGARARRLRRLAIGVLALASLGFIVSQAGRLPGAAGELVRTNIEVDRDTTALFYTEVDGWNEWAIVSHR